ncbi:penicillin amidase [Anaerobacterium chartisolvens]|uniref:Penicillin amidase n=1 Tax=Anaerobacterium chartisolvens TaxID=1297424 RepID=A0A369B9Y6_9FIRM|nr:penicillin acylase family protein [Anaerobacterium chartisolvens]RCX18349.1 penicillin amidase [Anaerobacterium chartisolvens]
MKKLRKWAVRILCGLLAICIILVAAVTWITVNSWPKTNGTVDISSSNKNKGKSPEAVETLASLKHGTVEIIRDKWGVPQIYADNEYDLLFGQGYVHAQDRLWAMEMNRHTSNGRLSEIFGKMGVEMDSFYRTLGLSRSAEETWKKLDKDSRFLLEAYAAGVNEFIDTHRGSLPIEFKVLGIDPEPWTPVDTLTLGNVMAFFMSYNYQMEIIRAKIIANNGRDAVKELFPFPSDNTTLMIPDEAQDYYWLKDKQVVAFDTLKALGYETSSKWGSNNWVVSGSLTKTGKPILANDTHLNLGMPSIWYENGLHGGRFDCAGFTFPGIPLVITGHNQRIAWGITNMNSDVQDLYLEKLDNNDNPTQYEFQGNWYKVDTLKEKINVKGGSSEELTTYFTRHGPIINKVIGISNSSPIALRWTLSEGSMLIKAVIDVNCSKNWTEFRSALKNWDNACQNFVYADVDGNIGYQAACKVPIRESKHQGIVPVPGWTGEYEWKGYIPFEELPTSFNPQAGFIVTTNNKITPENYKYTISYDWAPGDRAARISNLIKSKAGKLTVEDMKDIQADTYSMTAESLRPFLLEVTPGNEFERKALEKIRNWDLNTDNDSIGASIYETWYNFMIKHMFAKNLGLDEKANQGPQFASSYLDYSDMHQPTMIKLMSEPNSRWFDDRTTLEVEKRDDIIRKSFKEALSKLKNKLGRDIEDWEWGKMHTVTFTHMPFGIMGIPVIGDIFNSKTLPASGSLSTVNMAQYSWKSPFIVGFGTSQRMIVDINNLDEMLVINTSGQCAVTFNKNREDQIQLWWKNDYIPMFFKPETVRKNGKDVLSLRFKE